MAEDELVSLAKEYCEHYHQGQVRRGNGLPYATHPVAVADILAKYGYTDTVTQCMALLHDVVEDGSLIAGEIDRMFGYEIANGVFVLSRNTLNTPAAKLIGNIVSVQGNLSADELYRVHLSDEQLYKVRLSFARKTTQRVKIADMIHNTSDLPTLRITGIQRKIDDAQDFYIPLGQIIAPIMVQELSANIEAYQSAKTTL